MPSFDEATRETIRPQAANSAALADLIGLGEYLLGSARVDGALRCFDLAIARDAVNARAHRGRARALFQARLPRAALQSFARSLDCGAELTEIAEESWKSAMLSGNFEAAWQISDRILTRRTRADLNRRDQPYHRRPVWDGSPLADRNVLVRCYHGFADAIQFIRYVPLVRQVARSVTVQAVPSLHGVLARCAGVDRLATLDEGAKDPRFDVDIALMELPHALRTTLATIPATIPYLHVPPTAQRLARRNGRLHVGLAWRAGEWNSRRSIPLEQLAGLDRIPGVVLVNLQRGPGVAEFQSGARAPFAERLAIRPDDVLETAATIAALDLVISVDTVVAHVAGALGVEVWTLLDAAADWRWMVGRDDSPWYPSMRLFRQERPGHWGPVVAAVAAALRRKTNTSPAKDVR